MDWSVGDKVVFGTDGALIVRAVKSVVREVTISSVSRETRPKTFTDVILGFPFDSDRTILTMADHWCLHPLSWVLGSGGVPAVLAELAGPVPEQEPREEYHTMIGIITSHDDEDEVPPLLDARAVAQVVRNLTARQARQGLDERDSKLLAQARTILVSEVGVAADLDQAQAEAAIDEALAVHRTPA